MACRGAGIVGRCRLPLLAGLALTLALACLLAASTPASAAYDSLELVSGGTGGGNGGYDANYAGVAPSGSHVYFWTREPIAATDTDTSIDTYDRTTTSTTSLLSTGPFGGNGAFPSNFAAASQTGGLVIFGTDERLTSQDTDNSFDIYQRSGSTTTRLSAGPTGGNGNYDTYFMGASKDGTKVFLETNEALTSDDTDSAMDVYMRSGGTTTLLSTGPAGGNGSGPADFQGTSDDGSHVFFATKEALTSDDTDSRLDLYERFNGTTTRVSTGPAGGNGDFGASYEGSSTDGTRVFFSTSEALTSDDTDSLQDIYQRFGGTTTLVSVGSQSVLPNTPTFSGASPDGTKVYFETLERLEPGDTDGFDDVYMRSGNTTTLLSPGGGNSVSADARYDGTSDDGSKVFIDTSEPLLAGDTDRTRDVYMSQNGSLTLMSTGPAGGNGQADAYYGGSSPDGSSLVFYTYESLVASDTDTATDVYERAGGTTSILTGGPGGGNGPYDADFAGVTPDAKRVFFRTRESLDPTDTDTSADLYAASVSGQVSVVLDSQPNDPQDFTFTPGGGLSYGLGGPPQGSPFTLDDDSDGTLSNSYTFNHVSPGTGYSVAQAVPSGWDLTGQTCDDGSSPSNIDVSPGENVTCTFTNRKRGKVVLVVDSQPNDAQDFTFGAGGGLAPTSVTLDDDSDPALSNTATFDNLVPGSGYSLSQGSTPAGWDLSSFTCSDGSPVTNIDVSAGETVTCTATERKRGQIVIVKDAQPDDPQDFSFTAGGGLSPTSFSLDDDTDPTLSNSRTFTNLPPASGYSVSETVPSGWDQSGATCDNGSTPANITVSAGQTVTCTFTNKKRGGIIVVLDAVPNNGQDFAYTAGGGLSPASFSLDDDNNPTLSNTRSFANVAAGSGYSLTQTTPSGWALVDVTCNNGSTAANLTVAPGQTVTCTFTNWRDAKLTVTKDAQPNDPQDFAFSINGGLSPPSFSLDDDSDPTLPNSRTYPSVTPGSYNLSETPVAGWDSTASCSNGNAPSALTLGAGDNVTCTFVNKKRGQLVIVDDSQPDDPQDFAFTAGGGLSPATFSLDDDTDPTLSNTQTFTNLPAASGYSVSETVPSGWALPTPTCSNGSSISNITINPGETVTCTFTNQKRGQIVIVKDATPDDPQDFSFSTSGGLSPSSFSLDDDADPTLSNTRTFSDIAPGTGYGVAETVPTGWDQTSATCSNGSQPSNILVSPAQTVTCTFANRKRGQIVVTADSVPNDPQDFAFTAGGGLSPTSFALDDDSDPTLSNTRTFANVVPGSGYSLSETVPSGWDQTSATCDNGSSPANVTVGTGQTVNCTFTNRKRGRIVLLQDSQPDDPQDFSYTAGGGLSPTSFNLDDDTDPTLSNTRTFADLVPGAGYSLAQSVPTGWDRTSATCDDGSSPTNIDVAAGETVTCTFTDRKRGKIVVVHDSIPDDPQDFSFATGGGLSPSSFSLDDDTDPTLSNTRTFTDVIPGSYSVAGSVPSGWDRTSATCDDGSSTGSISVAAGETVTCTFVATKRGGVVLTEDSQPDDPQDFSFTAGGGLSPASFSLDDDTDPTLSNTRTFSDLLPASGYSLAQTGVSGWDLTSSTCDDGSSPANIAISPGEVVNCTFTNRERGQIVVVQNSTPNDPQDFSFTAGGGLSPTSFALDDDSDPTLSNSRTFASVVPGSGYSLAETIPSGWDLTSATCDDGSLIGNVNVSPGETVTCTFNTRKRGQVVVTEDSIPNDPQDFFFSADGLGASFNLDDDSDPTLSNTRTFANVVPGSGYALSETVPSGWDQTSATCDNGSSPGSISVAPGEVVHCSFANTKRGSVIAVHSSNPSDPQDFAFTAGGGLSPASFSLDDDTDPTLSNTRTFTNVLPSSGYSLSEAVPAGWDRTSASCDDGSAPGAIAVSPGETVTCTFADTKRASLTVVKDAVPSDPQDFSFTAGGGSLGPQSFQLDDDSDPTLPSSTVFNDLLPQGGYSVAEAAASGWDQTSATCSDGSPIFSITLSPGEAVTCTFTNTKQGNLVVNTQSTPNDPQDFSFTAGGGLSPSSFSLDDDSDPTLSNTRTFTGVSAGSGYSLAETVPGGWDLTSATCDDGDQPSAISIAPGQTVTCTFANRKRGQLVVKHDSVPNDPQDFSFTAGGGLSPSSFALDDDSDGTLSDTRTFANVVPGSSYSLSEGLPPGWDRTSATCDDGSDPAAIDVGPGENVTCTFTDTKRSSIVVTQDSQPDDPQDFGFSAGGGLSPASFSLDDDSDPTLSNTRSFTDIAPGSGYSVAQTVPAGWDQTSAVCSDGSPIGNIDLSPGEIVTCAFTDAKRASLTVVHDAIPDDPLDFSFTAGGGLSPSAFSLDDDSDPTLSNTQSFPDVLPGTGYSLNEVAPSGWDLTGATCSDGSPIFNITLTAGEDVTCTFTNRKRGRIVVVKNATPSDPQDFSFSAGGGLSPTSFALDDDSDPTLSNTRTFTDVTPGSGYSVSESVPSSWQQTSATCDDGSPPSNIDVSAGETVTCTFSNSKRGRVVVVQDSTPNDPQDFSFTAGGGLSPSSFGLDDDSDPTLSNTRSFDDVAPGSGYSLAQSVPSGWDQTSASCDDGSPLTNISVSPSETVTCTFADTKLARIIVVKDAIPNDPQDFSFSAGGGLSPASFSLDDDSDPTLSNTRTFADVQPGSGYSLGETVPSGWIQNGATCDDSSPVDSIAVTAGETVTCTFTNVKGYPRPKGATPVRVTLVPAFEQCTATNSSHGSPLSYPSCTPPVQSSGYLTVGTPDANGKTANSAGFVRYKVIAGNPSTPADEADVGIDMSLTDVRNKSDLNDYTGELSAAVMLRITDRLNGADTAQPGTIQDTPLAATVPCAATTSTTVGSTCSVSTTADAILPGTVTEIKRTIWALGQIQVYDGGADGVASTTGDNTVFARQGIFVP